MGPALPPRRLRTSLLLSEGVTLSGFDKRGGVCFPWGEVTTPLPSPASADLNMTLGMALLFMGLWLVWTIQEVGVIGFLKEQFVPKGDVSGLLRIALVPIFFFVGINELISIAIRPVSLSFWLFGNIYAGETLLHTIQTIWSGLPFGLGFLTSLIFLLPFSFLEFLVGLLQAFVFA